MLLLLLPSTVQSLTELNDLQCNHCTNFDAMHNTGTTTVYVQPIGLYMYVKHQPYGSSEHAHHEIIESQASTARVQLVMSAVLACDLGLEVCSCDSEPVLAECGTRCKAAYIHGRAAVGMSV